MAQNLYNIKPGCRFSGTIERAENKLVKISLSEDSLARLEKRAGSAVVECTEGIIWVTQEKDFADYLLHKGERLIINKNVLVMIMALTDAEARVGTV